MTRALDELQACVREGLREPAGGADGNLGVFRVGMQEHRRLDRRDGGLQLPQLAQQGALLGQERAPERAVLPARAAPDLPVDVLVRADQAAAAPPDAGKTGPGDPWCPPPGDPGAQMP